MSIAGLNHFTVLTDDVEATVRFYGEILDLHPGPRPDFAFPGAWLYADRQPIVHIVGGCSPAELKPGVLDHMAFDARDLATTVARLRERGIAHSLRRLRGANTWQLFFHDPNGAKIELAFAADESPQ